MSTTILTSSSPISDEKFNSDVDDSSYAVPVQHFQHRIKRTYNVNKHKRQYEDMEGDVKPKKGAAKSINNNSTTNANGSTNSSVVKKDAAGSSTSTSTNTKKRKYGFSFCYEFNLLPHLTQEYQERHQLSAADFQKIIKYTEPEDLWKMCIVNKLELTTSAIQSGEVSNSGSLDGDEQLSYAGNAQFHKKIETFISSKKLSTVSKLIAKRDAHRPQLPLHFVTPEVLRSMPAPSEYCSQLYEFNGIYCVPASYYNGYLKMAVVVPRHIHELVFSKPKNMLTRPAEYLIDGLVYSSTFECFFLQTIEGHERLCKMTNQDDIRALASALLHPPTSSYSISSTLTDSTDPDQSNSSSLQVLPFAFIAPTPRPKKQSSKVKTKKKKSTE